MLSAIFQHIYRIFSFSHNGQGLQTSKYFTFILMFVCLVFACLGESSENLTVGFIVFEALLLGLIYVLNINKKETINAVFMIVGVFLAVSIFSSLLSYVVLVWGFIALNVMNSKRLNG